jgi:MIP family channel proteins
VERRNRSAYLGELVGTFFLVLAIGIVVAAYYRAPDIIVIGIVHFLALAMIVATIGPASGAHVNPAVTIAFAAVRKIAPADAAIYVLMQLTGAVLAALTVKLLIQDGSEEVTAFGATFIPDEGPLEGKAAAGLLAEALGAFLLMWAYMGTLVNPAAPREWAPLVIGGTLGFAVMLLAPLTGASLNPARSFGPALVSGDFGATGEYLLAYVLGPVVGALAAAGIYSAVILRGPGVRPQDKLSAPGP